MPTHDLVTDHGGVADGQRQTVTATISNDGSARPRVLTLDTAIFASGDVGKAISLTASGYFYTGTIATFTSSTVVNLSSNASALSAVSTDVLWGTENATAFTAYNTWALGQVGVCTLTMPAGRFCWSSTGFNYAFKGIAQSVIQGAGKTSTILSQLAQGQMYFGSKDPVQHKGLTDAAGNSARIYTAVAGATTIRLKDVTYASKFTANRYIKITGYDMQGVWNSPYGYPPNPFYYEDNYITGISGDTITLRSPLVNTYKETWPNWNSGSAGEADPGGPATIYMPDASYDCSNTLNDFTIDNYWYQSVAHGRSTILNRIAMTGGSGLYPTQNGYFEANSVDWSTCNLEIDKINGTCVFNSCDFNILKFQSASPDLCTVTGGTIKQLTGTPKVFVGTGIAFQDLGGANDAKIQIGAGSFGRTDEVTLTSCTGIKTFAIGSATNTGIHLGGASATMTMTAGVIAFLNTDNDGAAQENPSRTFVPGTWLLLDYKIICRVTDVTQDATYTYVATTLTGGWPFTTGTIIVHPAPRITVRGCTGTAPELEDWNQAPARIPLYSYSKRTLVAGASSTTGLAIATRPFLIGKLVTEKINVTTIYTGALTIKDAQFANGAYMKLSDYSLGSDYGNTVNMHLVGERVIRSATTATGAQTSDVLKDMTSLGEVNFYNDGNRSVVFSANVTNGETPTATIEYTMDHGIPPVVPTAVVPLRLRLHA